MTDQDLFLKEFIEDYEEEEDDLSDLLDMAQPRTDPRRPLNTRNAVTALATRPFPFPDALGPINWDYVRVFYYVVDKKGLQNAAQSLHVSRSIIGRLMEKLEAQAGHRLYFRGAPKFRMTKAGQKMWQIASTFHMVMTGLETDLQQDEKNALDVNGNV